ncbi:hypothetical protein IAT40_005741 [Kwoniella sp. CBS 6097]
MPSTPPSGSGDINASWRGNHRYNPSLTTNEDQGSTSEAESRSSQQGWSDAGWKSSTNPRPSLSSSEEHLPSSHTQLSQSHLPYSQSSSQPSSQPQSHSNSQTDVRQGQDPSIIYGIHPSFAKRRSTLTRPSIHTAGSNVSLNSLHPQLPHQQHGQQPPAYGGGKDGHGHGHGPTILTLDMNASPSRFSPNPGNNYGQPGSSHGHGQGTSSSAYAASTYARARRNQVEVESEDEEPYSPGSGPAGPSHPSKGKGKKKRGGSFSLPFHRKRRLSASLPWPLRWWPGGGGGSSSTPSISVSSPKQPRSRSRSILFALLLLGSLIYGLSIWRKKYEVQVEFSVFSKKWVREEVDTISPLRGCFNSQLLSSHYNMSQHLAPKRHMLSPGISLKRGMSCYDFSSTIQPIPNAPVGSLTYHTYWRSDLIPFGERQTATFLSFLATQPLPHSKLILWTNGAKVLSSNPYVKPYLEKWGEYIQVRQVDMAELTAGTQLQGVISSKPGEVFDQRAWVDGDAIRLLVLWHYGGVWMDMDQILTRDLHPLTESEWVTQWDCYDKPYFSLNGALMHFRQHSPYLCEAFHLMASSPFPKPNTFTWGSHLYSKLHRSLLAAHIKPFEVLPWCFADPRNCRTDNRFPDPFMDDPDVFAGKKWHYEGGREDLEERVGQVWSVHLHNQWAKEFPQDGWIGRLLGGYKGQLEVLERYAEAKGLYAGGPGGGGRIKLENEDEQEG